MVLNLFKRRLKRAINFPQDSSLGRLYVPDANGYTFFAVARGTVMVPEGISLHLRVTSDAGTLAPLKTLAPQDLSGFSLTHTDRSDDDLQNVSALTGLTALHFDYTQLTGAGLKWLNLLNPHFLSARQSHFSDDGASFMAGMTALQIVNLSVTRVTERALAHLANLPALNSLFLWENAITCEAGASLNRLKSLARLSLGGTRFGDKGLNAIEDLPGLLALELERSAVTDASLQTIQRLTKLAELGLSHNNITDRGIEKLADHPALRKLTLAKTAVTDRSVKLLARLTNLEELDLAGTGLTDAALPALSLIASLKTVNLSGTAVTAEGIALLKRESLPFSVIWAPQAEVVAPDQLRGEPFYLPEAQSAGAIALDALPSPLATATIS